MITIKNSINNIMKDKIEIMKYIKKIFIYTTYT